MSAAPIPPSHQQVPMAEMQEAAEQACNLLKGIGNPNRLLILCLLTEGEKTVTELSQTIGMRQSLTSQHLARLRFDGLVRSERREHHVFYSIENPVVAKIVSTLYLHYCG